MENAPSSPFMELGRVMRPLGSCIPEMCTRRCSADAGMTAGKHIWFRSAIKLITWDGLMERYPLNP